MQLQLQNVDNVPIDYQVDAHEVPQATRRYGDIYDGVAERLLLD
jgi:hypothetical protein